MQTLQSQWLPVCSPVFARVLYQTNTVVRAPEAFCFQAQKAILVVYTHIIKFSSHTCHFARVVKGVDLKSTSESCVGSSPAGDEFLFSVCQLFDKYVSRVLLLLLPTIWQYVSHI